MKHHRVPAFDVVLNRQTPIEYPVLDDQTSNSSEQKKKLDRVQHRVTRNSNSKLDSVIPKPHQSNV